MEEESASLFGMREKAKEAKGLVGNIWIITCAREGASLPEKLLLATILTPSPGEIISATKIAKLIAMAVVARYKATALPPMRPSLLVSFNEHTPQTRDTNTKGTTSIRKLAINTWPITSNMPSTNKPLRESSNKYRLITLSEPLGISHSKKVPKRIPATIPITIRLVKLFFLGEGDVVFSIVIGLMLLQHGVN